jgi:hypothetical protein
MQSIWVLTYNDVEGNPLICLFATEKRANDYAAHETGPFVLNEYGLEGVSAETYLHHALTAVFQLPTSRESSLVKTKIQEAQLWLECTDQGIHVQRAGTVSLQSKN